MPEGIEALFYSARNGCVESRDTLVLKMLNEKFSKFLGHYKRIYSEIYEDAYQDCFIALTNAVTGGGDPGKITDPELYLCRAMFNSITRTINAMPENCSDSTPKGVDQDFLETIIDDVDRRSEVIEAAVDALLALPAIHQMIVTDKLKGESFREIARTHGISREKAQAHYKAAINVIRENQAVQDAARELHE